MTKGTDTASISGGVSNRPTGVGDPLHSPCKKERREKHMKAGLQEGK